MVTFNFMSFFGFISFLWQNENSYLSNLVYKLLDLRKIKVSPKYMEGISADFDADSASIFNSLLGWTNKSQAKLTTITYSNAFFELELYHEANSKINSVLFLLLCFLPWISSNMQQAYSRYWHVLPQSVIISITAICEWPNNQVWLQSTEISEEENRKLYFFTKI